LCEDGCFFGREGALGRRGCDSKKTLELEECDVAPPSLFPSCLREGGEAMWGAWARGGGSGGWPGGGPRGRSGGPSPRGPRPGPGTATGTRGQRPAAQGGGSTARHPCRTPPPGGRGEEGRGLPSLSSPKGCVAVGTGDPGGLMGGRMVRRGAGELKGAGRQGRGRRLYTTGGSGTGAPPGRGPLRSRRRTHPMTAARRAVRRKAGRRKAGGGVFGRNQIRSTRHQSGGRPPTITSRAIHCGCNQGTS